MKQLLPTSFSSNVPSSSNLALTEKYSNNVYFLISEQGILLKAKTFDYLKKADNEITKFFTAKIEEL